jgi:uncharacterized Zn finger protein (UPF0148 family)
MSCPVCGTVICSALGTMDGITIVCPNCGEYDISNVVLASEQWQRLEPEERCDVLLEAKHSAQPGGCPVIATYSPLLARPAPSKPSLSRNP